MSKLPGVNHKESDTVPMSRSTPAFVVTLSLATALGSIAGCRRPPANKEERATPAPLPSASHGMPMQPSAALPPSTPPVVNDATGMSPAANAALTDGGAVAAPVAGGPLPGTPASFAPLVRRVRPSVVSIFTAHVETMGMQYGFGSPRERISRGLGTGFLINSNGEVLTNNHVIEGAQLIEVQLDDGRRFGADVIGRDPRVDVALLRLKGITGVALAPAPLGNSDQMEVGDWVLAIGNPFGLAQTVTTGIVSAMGRTGRDVPLDPAGYYSFIQTDASINPGNSGGPLLNLRGEVIGIYTAVNRAGQGIGFAIPINMISTILPQLRQYGRVIRSWLGISIHAVDEQARAAFGLPDTHGAMVVDVDPAGPAAAAGLRSGDVIRRFDASEIRESSELSWLASTAGIGHQAHLQVLRGAQSVELDVGLTAMPEMQPVLMPQGNFPGAP
jgi:serine protease Do